MRYALISDIHANLPALDAVLADVDARRDADEMFHLGDLVGYGPWADDVVSRIHERGIVGVGGNYDSTVATRHKHCGCRYEDAQQEELSHRSYAWTLEHVTVETINWLARLPFRIDLRPLGGHVVGPTLTLVHGNQTLNTVYVTEDRSDDFLARMGQSIGASKGDIIAFGHTHKPWQRIVAGVHYVNTGSVGRPKDGDWRAGYVLLAIDLSGVSVEFRRVEYDVEQAASAILASTLPHEFAHFLRSGGASLVPV